MNCESVQGSKLMRHVDKFNKKSDNPRALNIS